MESSERGTKSRRYHGPIARAVVFWLNSSNRLRPSNDQSEVRHARLPPRPVRRFKMSSPQEAAPNGGVHDLKIREALDQHWAASDASDFEAEHRIYHDDAVLEYPQSGERIRGRKNIQLSRMLQPNKKRFTIRRVIGNGSLWITEFILTYDDKPSYTVSIMEFQGDQVARETQYFADPFEPGASRAALVERMSP